ncbi:MAG: hypothetical protein IT158_31575 [Bryobacterales bacterium]|nr:hypothetical protein [Bryobacterales bacterium]
MSLANDPKALSVVLGRRITSAVNSAAHESMVIVDGWESNLVSQSAGAIRE